MQRGTPLGWLGRTGAIAALLLLAGCPEPEVRRRYGTLQVETAEGDSRAPLFDFGPVFRGQSEGRTLILKNLGQGELTLTAATVTTGDASRVGLVADAPGALFTVPLPLPLRIAPGGEQQVEMRFTPPVDEAAAAAEDFLFRLTLVAEGARAGEGEAVLTLKGQAISGRCELPSALDFGPVAVGDMGLQQLVISNPSALEATAQVGEVESTTADALAFLFEDGSARGTVPIPARSNVQVRLGFHPTEARSYLATVRMRAADGCPEVPVTLTGQGVDQVLTWRVDNAQLCRTRSAQGVCLDSDIDCGQVPPNGATVQRTLTFLNVGAREVELRELAFSRHPSEFSVVGEVGVGRDNPLRVPARQEASGAAGEAQLVVACRRSSLGPVTAALSGRTNLDAQDPFGYVRASVVGGGPDIQVRPSPTLHFGPVAWFPDATEPLFVTRRMVVANVGTLSNDPRFHLHLGQQPDGTAGAPWVVEETEGTEAGTFSVALAAGSTLPAEGLVARPGENQVVLEVRVTPRSLGRKTARLTLVSNDLDSPRTTVELTAEVRDVPPCEYTLTPSRLDFGLVPPGSVRERHFTLTNLAADPNHLCLVSGVQLVADSDPAFSLPEYAEQLEGAPMYREIPGGGSMQVVVRVQPRGSVGSNILPIFGTAEFFISSPTRPRGEVQLEADVATACLTVLPIEHDFGVVEKGCNSNVRSFGIYNSCTRPVTLLGFNMLDAAGLPGQPEFTLFEQPQLPTGGLVLQPGAPALTFSVRYRPVDFTQDTGHVAISAVQDQQPVSYVVTVRGRGDTEGLNTDVFAQDRQPKSDMLFCIDNSFSMEEEIDAVAGNFDSFIQYARNSGVDYHIAVISSDMDEGSELDQGRFRAVPGSGERILTRATPDVEPKFAELVRSVGINGSGDERCFDAIRAALTTELVHTENAGFLREDANLAVVVVTDEKENSDDPVQKFLGQFLGIKGQHRSHLFSFSAIAGFDPNCPDLGSADDGRYATMVEETGGLKDNICTPDWSKTLEELGRITSGYRTRFRLTNPPDLSGGNTLHVELTDQEGDTMQLPAEEGGQRVWSYDGATNEVVFEPSYVPEPGQTLSVTYKSVCYTD